MVARAFVDLMIEQGGFSNVQNEFGGTMHQYQERTYADVVKALQDNDPIIQQARASEEGFWATALQ